MEDLVLNIVSHVQHFGDQSKPINAWILSLGQYFRSLVSYLLSHNCPVLVYLLLATGSLLQVEGQQFLSDPHLVIDVLLNFSH